VQQPRTDGTDERPSLHHSITLSALSSTDRGILITMTFAVFRLTWYLHGQLGRLRAAQDAIDIADRASQHLRNIGPEAQQTARVGELRRNADRYQLAVHRESSDLAELGEGPEVDADEDHVGCARCDAIKGRGHVIGTRRRKGLEAHPQPAGGTVARIRVACSRRWSCPYRIPQHRHALRGRRGPLSTCKTLPSNSAEAHSVRVDVAARARQAVDKPGRHWVDPERHHDRDAVRGTPRGGDRIVGVRDDQLDLRAHQFVCERGQPLGRPFGKPDLEDEVTTLLVAGAPQQLAKEPERLLRCGGGLEARGQSGDAPHRPGRLSPTPMRPREQCAAREHADHCSTRTHSITLSGRSGRLFGRIVMPTIGRSIGTTTARTRTRTLSRRLSWLAARAYSRKGRFCR